jgi:hypothetical protein
MSTRRPELAGCRWVRTAASIVVRVGIRVQVSGSSGGLKNTRIIERTQWFILIRAIGALRPAADDPYTQKHIKSGGYNMVVERFGRGLARC